MTSKNVHIIPQNTPKASSIPVSNISFVSLNNKIATAIRPISAIANSNKCSAIIYFPHCNPLRVDTMSTTPTTDIEPQIAANIVQINSIIRSVAVASWSHLKELLNAVPIMLARASIV